MSITKQFSLFFSKRIIKKLIAYSLLILVIYILKDFLWLFLLTFIFWYLAYTLAWFLNSRSNFLISRFISKIKTRKLLKKIFSIKFFIIIEYIIFIWIIFILATKLIPNVAEELLKITKSIPELKWYILEINKQLSQFWQIEEIGGYLKEMLNNNELFTEKNLDILKNIFEQIKTVSGMVLKIFIALILSFAFIIDFEKLKKYFNSMKTTSFAFFHEEYNLVITTVVNSFWKVFKAQTIIALVNTILTTLWLIIIWLIFKDSIDNSWTIFPFIYTLAIIVFICWFIPVVWTFISSIPIIIVAIAMWWWINSGILVLLMILLVHALEAYYLNPKIVSGFMKIPISLTFLILIISEHLMWIAWLIVWVSLFNFFEELLKDIDRITKKNNKKIAKQE